MKYLGLDYGTRNIGVAISDAGGGFAFARDVVANDNAAIARIARLVHEEKIDKIVMGDTRTGTGASNTITAEAEAFVRTLERESGVSVMFVPELWSSFEAARYAPDQHHDDSAAAAIILQRYIDMHSSLDKVE